MRIAELSSRTGVSKPTIRYYIREGLLWPGKAAASNQAYYGEHHVRRLRLVRALVEVGDLSVASTREVLRAVDQAEDGVDAVLGRILGAVVDDRPVQREASRQEAAKVVADLIRRRRWACDNEAVRNNLVDVVASFYNLDQEDLLVALDVYAEAADQIAAADLDAVAGRRDVDAILDGAIVGTILGGALLLALRRVAHVHASAKTFA